jgi:hypothetical protein
LWAVWRRGRSRRPPTRSCARCGHELPLHPHPGAPPDAGVRGAPARARAECVRHRTRLRTVPGPRSSPRARRRRRVPTTRSMVA